MQIELSNGLNHVWQWDKDITVTVPEGVDSVHFRWGNRAVEIPIENQTVTIPPELMQKTRKIRMWTYTPEHTMDMADIPVEPKNKPADYVYTPTEIKTWEQLDERIKALEQGGGIAGVSSVNGQTGAVEITAKGLGALTEDDLQGATDKALAQAKESGAFDGAQGPKGDTGTDGKSAYQYAQDGGYTGTEADFTTKLAQGTLSGTTNDLTPAQVHAAVSAGRPVKIQYTSNDYGILSFTAFNIAETLNAIISQTIVMYHNEYVLAELCGLTQLGQWLFYSTALAGKKDIPTVPSSLKNPNALTIKIGSNTVTYDGSSAQTAEITNGKDGVSPTVSTVATTGGTAVTITDAKGSHEFVVKNGAKGAPGTNGTTPHIGDNGNWYLGETDTGKPSRGQAGAGLDVTGATVGQIVKIAAVDSDGVPTAWSPVDMPSGGSGSETWALVAEITTTENVNSIRATFDACSAVVVEFFWGGVENDLGDIGIFPNTGDTPYVTEQRAAAAMVTSSTAKKRGVLCVRMDCRVGSHWYATSWQKDRGDGSFGAIDAGERYNLDIGLNGSAQYSFISSYYMTTRDDTPASGVKSITAYGAGMAIGTTLNVWGIKK